MRQRADKHIDKHVDRHGNPKKRMSKKKRLLLIVVIFFAVLAFLVAIGLIGVYYFMNSTATGPSPAGKHYQGQDIKKSETVYVDTDSSGSPASVVVDAYLRNNPEVTEIVDRTSLTDIININGNEEYSTNKDGTITWPANGSDIYYEGTAGIEDVPVEMNVKYYLNGKQISGEKLEGKSGKLEIHIKYRNKKMVDVGGESVHVPFMVLSAIIVNDNSLSKIKINNGKVMNQAGVKVAMGVTAPGLLDGVDMPALNDALGNELIIKGVAKNFKGNEIISMVSNDMLKFVSNKSLNKLNLDKKITKLDTATKQIIDGSGKLAGGISLIKSRTPELTDGISQAREGSKKLADSTYEAMTKLGDGSKKLGQLGKAIQESVTYIDGITSDSGSDKGIVSMSEDVAEITTNLNAKMITSNVTADGIKKMTEAVEASNMSDTDKKQTKAYLDVLNELETSRIILLTEAGRVSKKLEDIDRILDGQRPGETLDPFLKQQIDGMSDSEQLKRADDTYMGLVDITKLWNEKNNEMSDTLDSLANDEDSLAAGAKKLAQGMRKIDNGAAKFESGINKLDKGSSKLNKGLIKYYNQGIKKIVDMYNNQLSGVAKDLRQMKAAGEKYNNYSGITDEMNGSVTFVYFTPMGNW